MNKAMLRERIRSGPVRDPVGGSNDPPIYHAARPNGKSLRVAYYRRVKSDIIDINIYHELETHCARQWIDTKTDWDLKGVFMDADPSWAAFEEMKNGKFDMIVARTISSFGHRFSEAVDRISALPFPVYFEAENILSTDEKYKVIVDMLIEEEQKRRKAGHPRKAQRRSEVITA